MLNRRDKRRLVESLNVSYARRGHEAQSDLAQTAKASALESLTNDGVPADQGGIEAADPSTPTRPPRPTPSARPISPENANAA